MTKNKTTTRNPSAPLSRIQDTDTVRTSMVFSGAVWKIVQRMMARRGFNNNLSGYLADLARRDEERHIELNVLRHLAGEADGLPATDMEITLAAREIIRRAAKKARQPGRAPAVVLPLHDGESPGREIRGFRPGATVPPPSDGKSPPRLPVGACLSEAWASPDNCTQPASASK